MRELLSRRLLRNAGYMLLKHVNKKIQWITEKVNFRKVNIIKFTRGMGVPGSDELWLKDKMLIKGKKIDRTFMNVEKLRDNCQKNNEKHGCTVFKSNYHDFILYILLNT